MQFDPTQQILSKLLQDTSFNIPPYQRPYSWDCEGKTDQNNQINAMWDDLYTAFQENLVGKKDEGYFLGSIVVIGKEFSKNYTVVDGQQRLTSLLLLLTSIKCFLLNAKSSATFLNAEKRIEMATKNIDDTIFLRGELGEIDQERPKKLIIEKLESFDYDIFLKMSLECVPTPTTALYKKMADDDVMKEMVKTLLNILDKAQPEYQKTALRYFNNRDYFGKQLQLSFLENGVLTESLFKLLINSFYKFIIDRVIVVQLRTVDLDTAYQVFEILNNRGLPLSNKDLFRNFIIQAFSAAKKANPEKYWQHLEKNYQLDAEFISRYVESKHGEKQRKSAFNDIKAIYESNRFNSNIQSFYEDITLNLEHYTHISRQSFSNPLINNRIYCILQTGNNAITISLLMAICRNIKNEGLILEYLNIYEKYALYLEVATKKRFSAPLLYEAIKKLNQGEDKPMDNFLLSADDKSDFRKALQGEFLGAKNDVARLFLARYVWAEDDAIKGEDLTVFNLLYNKITLEHIIPQTPDEKTNWTTDFKANFRKVYTYKLGNMTLLTQTLNSAAKNYDWKVKREKYRLTHLVMTRLVAEQTEITPTYIENRQKHIVETLIKALDL